jgi:hypothetical protein
MAYGGYRAYHRGMPAASAAHHGIPPMNAHLSRLRTSLSPTDWGIVAVALILDISLILPWVSFGGMQVRPADLLGTWALVGLLALIVLATVVAGHWPYTRWLALVPLVGGCLLLGVLFGVAGVALALNPLLARLPWQEANEIAQTASRLAGIVRLPTAEMDRLGSTVNRFALEPLIAFRVGSGLFGASALALIVVGYHKIVQCFAASAPPPPAPATPDVDLISTN